MSVDEPIDSFVKLKQGWDEEDALPIAQTAIDNAKVLHYVIKTAPEPQPMQDGAVLLEWMTPYWDIAISIDDEGLIHGAMVRREDTN